MPNKPEKSQVDKFREAARAFGVDVSDAEYDDAVGKVATAPKLSDAEIRDLAKQLRGATKR